MYPPDGLLTSGYLKHDVEHNPHIIAPDPLASDDCLDVFSLVLPFPPPEPEELNTMNPSEDEPSSGLNGRLRPRRSTIPSPLSIKSIVRKLDDKPVQEKKNRSSTPTKASPSKPEDLSNIPNLLPTPQLLCPYCDRKFGTKQTVSKHTRRIHLSGSKPESSIVCLYCNHVETEPSDIIRHMTDSHPNQYFACLDCHTRFPSTKELAEHKLNICEKQKIPYRSKLRTKVNKKSQKTLHTNNKDNYANKNFSGHSFNGIVISCELKPSPIHDDADIEHNITTNLILPPNKNISDSTVLENNALIVLDDIQWNRRIPSNFSFHNSDADQILSRLGVVHRSPKTGESTKKDWFRAIEDATQKFEKCFDTSFYSKVASNVQENLTKFLDGSFNFNPDPDSTIKTRKSKNSVVINTAEGFPILLAYEQYCRNTFDGYIPRSIAPKHKWKWENNIEIEKPWSSDQLKKDTHANNCIITLVSSLDIWTQLCMRKKFEDKFNITPVAKKTEKQNVISKELKDILESREIPSASSHIDKHFNAPAPNTNEDDFPASLGLMPTAGNFDVKPAILSGEWVRPRCYVCCACGAQSCDSRALSLHAASHHPNAQVQHYEIVGESLLKADILKHLYVPPSQNMNRTRPPRGIRDCTKCNKSIAIEELHQHMLDCAGDTPAVRRKCRYRPFGVRKRRPRLPDNTIRKKMRNDIRTRPTRQKNLMRSKSKIRGEVGDAETIRKMLADLPAKRHRVLVNPLNSILRPRRKLGKQRAMFMMKRRISEDPKSGKPKRNNNASRQDHSSNVDKHKGMENNDDDDNKPLKPRLKRVASKITRQKDSLNRKIILKKSRMKIRSLNDKKENDDPEKQDKSSPEKIQNNELSADHNDSRINLNSDPQNTREHSDNENTNNDRRDNQQPGFSRENDNSRNNCPNPAQNIPLKHSIASLTANSETHDKSVQFHRLFLIQQECNNTNKHVPTGQPVLFENEAVATRLDKPPLYCNQNVCLDPSQGQNEDLVQGHSSESVQDLDSSNQTFDSNQKNKLNKPRKGLNDCIAMLKNKLVDTDPNAPAHVSVQCGPDDPLSPEPVLLSASSMMTPKADVIVKPIEASPNIERRKKSLPKGNVHNEQLPRPSPMYRGLNFNYDMLGNANNERQTTQWRPVNYDAIMPRFIDNRPRKETSRRRSVTQHENIFLAQQLLSMTPPHDDMLIKLSSEPYEAYNLLPRQNCPEQLVNFVGNNILNTFGRHKVFDKNSGETPNRPIQISGRIGHNNVERNKKTIDPNKKNTRTRTSFPRKSVGNIEKNVNIRKDLPKSTRQSQSASTTSDKYRKKAVDCRPHLDFTISEEMMTDSVSQNITRRRISTVNTEIRLSPFKHVEHQFQRDTNAKMPLKMCTENSTNENEIAVPPAAHASSKAQSILAVPLDLSGKTLPIALHSSYDKYETLDLSNKGRPAERQSEDEIVDLRVKHTSQYPQVDVLKPQSYVSSQQDSMVTVLNLSHQNESMPTDLSIKLIDKDAHKSNSKYKLCQKVTSEVIDKQDLSKNKTKMISIAKPLVLDDEFQTELSNKHLMMLKNTTSTLKEPDSNVTNDLHTIDNLPNNLSRKCNDVKRNSPVTESIVANSHTMSDLNTSLNDNINYEGQTHDRIQINSSDNSLSHTQKPIYDPTLRIPQYKIRPTDIDTSPNESYVTEAHPLPPSVEKHSVQQVSSKLQTSTVTTNNSMIASIEAQERITYSFTNSVLNTAVTTAFGLIQQQPVYSLLNRSITTPFTRFESTKPVYALPNACISMAKIDVTTNSLLSIPSTTIISTTPVYTLAGTTMVTPLNYATLPNTGHSIPYPPPCGTYMADVDGQVMSQYIPPTSTTQEVRTYDNILTRGTLCSFDQENEDTMRLLLPNEIVRLLNSMPVDRRTQLLDVLLPYLSGSRPVPILSTQTTLFNNSILNMLTKTSRLPNRLAVDASTDTVDIKPIYSLKFNEHAFLQHYKINTSSTSSPLALKDTHTDKIDYHGRVIDFTNENAPTSGKDIVGNDEHISKEQVSTEQKLAAQILTKQTSTEQKSSEQVSKEFISIEPTPTEPITTEPVSIEQISTEEVSITITTTPNMQKSNNDKTASLRAVRIKAPSERQKFKMITNALQGVICPDVQGVTCPDTQGVSSQDSQIVTCPGVQDVICSDTQNMTCPDLQSVAGPLVQSVTCPDLQSVAGPLVQSVTYPDLQSVAGPLVQSVTCPDINDATRMDIGDVNFSAIQAVSCPETKSINCPDIHGETVSGAQSVAGPSIQEMNCLETQGVKCLDIQVATCPDMLSVTGTAIQSVTFPNLQGVPCVVNDDLEAEKSLYIQMYEVSSTQSNKNKLSRIVLSKSNILPCNTANQPALDNPIKSINEENPEKLESLFLKRGISNEMRDSTKVSDNVHFNENSKIDSVIDTRLNETDKVTLKQAPELQENSLNVLDDDSDSDDVSLAVIVKQKQQKKNNLTLITQSDYCVNICNTTSKTSKSSSKSDMNEITQTGNIISQNMSTLSDAVKTIDQMESETSVTYRTNKNLDETLMSVDKPRHSSRKSVDVKSKQMQKKGKKYIRDKMTTRDGELKSDKDIQEINIEKDNNSIYESVSELKGKENFLKFSRKKRGTSILSKERVEIEENGLITTFNIQENSITNENCANLNLHNIDSMNESKKESNENQSAKILVENQYPDDELINDNQEVVKFKEPLVKQNEAIIQIIDNYESFESECNLDKNVAISNKSRTEVSAPNDDHINTLSNEDIGLSIRRSRRGKSLYVDGKEQDAPVYPDAFLEQKGPLTKKQLIFSKLLLDAENNSKSSTCVTDHSTVLEENKLCEPAKLQVPPQEKCKSMKRKKSPFPKKNSKKKKSTDSSQLSDDDAMKSCGVDNRYIGNHPDGRLNSEEAYVVPNSDLSLDMELSSNIDSNPSLKDVKINVDLNKKIEPGITTKRKIAITADNKDSVHSSKPKKSKLNHFEDIVDESPLVTTDIDNSNRISINHNLPLAAKRTRSKSVVVTSSGSMLYDPYDINLEDMGEKTEPFRKQKLTTGNFKSQADNKLQIRTTTKDNAQSLLENNLETTTETTPAMKGKETNTSDSDESSKSDVPLKAYMEEKRRKSKLSYKTGDTKVLHENVIDVAITNDSEVKLSRKKHKRNKVIKTSIDNVETLDKDSKDMSEEQLRSEQFMESFGFFSERKPRKSNLLATKKISETFHIIANEPDDIYFSSKPRSAKKSSRSENRKAVEQQSEIKYITPSDFSKVPVKWDKNLKLRAATRYCHICKKEFRRTDNLVRHQMSLQHVTRLSETEPTPVPDDPNYLVIFKQHMDQLKILEHEMKSKKSSKSKFVLPTLQQILVDVKKTVREQQLARDQALFIDCCELLKDSNRGQIENRSVARQISACCPTSYALACVSPSEYDPNSGLSNHFHRYNKSTPNSSNLSNKPIIHTSAKLSGMANFILFSSTKKANHADLYAQPSTSSTSLIKCSTKQIVGEIMDERDDSGDVDSITAQSILESEEVKNLEKDLICGLTEAACKFKALLGGDSINSENIQNSEKVFVSENVVISESVLTSKSVLTSENVLSSEDVLRSENARNTENILRSENEIGTEKVLSSENRLVSENLDVTETNNSTPQESDKKDTVSKVKNVPDSKEKKNLDIADNIDIFEDKFDKIKRKCRSQAAAAKLVQTAVEPSISHKSRKKSEKKKGKRNSKKQNQNKVLTKGALKGYDSIKVSISTSDINMSAIIPPASSSKKKKKNGSKKKKDRKTSTLTRRVHCNTTKESIHKNIDIYEFSDNDEPEIFGLRPSTVMERFRNLNNKEAQYSTKVENNRKEVESSDSISDGDDFVYMSDDYVCSDDETENSLMSCELSNVKGSNEVKKSSSPLKRKDVMEKNVVMGKIFKHNAVRSEKKNKPKENTKPKANLDQLFDSLLEEEPNSTAVISKAESPKRTPQKERVFPPVILSKYDLKTSKSNDYSPKKVRSPSPSLSSDSADSRRICSFSSQQSPRRLLSSRYVTGSPFNYGPSTSKRYDDGKKYDRISTDYELSLTDRFELPPENKYDGIDQVQDKIKLNNDIDLSPKSDESAFDTCASRNTERPILRKKEKSPGHDATEYYDDNTLSDDAGVARQRARRKCTVGKQNILAETWSSESEPDGAPPRPNSAESVVLGAARKKKGRKRDGQVGGSKKGNKHISVKKQDFDGRVSSSNRTGGVSSSASGPGRSNEGSSAFGQHLSLPGPSGVAPRQRPSASYWADDDDDAPEHVQQHGWIVGDSHKKLVTMLAHAKGRKHNNDDKQQFMD